MSIDDEPTKNIESLSEETFIDIAVEAAIAFEAGCNEIDPTDPQTYTLQEALDKVEGWTAKEKIKWREQFRGMRRDDVFELIRDKLDTRCNEVGIRATKTTIAQMLGR